MKQFSKENVQMINKYMKKSTSFAFGIPSPAGQNSYHQGNEQQCWKDYELGCFYKLSV